MNDITTSTITTSTIHRFGGDSPTSTMGTFHNQQRTNHHHTIYSLGRDIPRFLSLSSERSGMARGQKERKITIPLWLLERLMMIVHFLAVPLQKFGEAGQPSHQQYDGRCYGIVHPYYR